MSQGSAAWEISSLIDCLFVCQDVQSNRKWEQKTSRYYLPIVAPIGIDKDMVEEEYISLFHEWIKKTSLNRLHCQRTLSVITL